MTRPHAQSVVLAQKIAEMAPQTTCLISPLLEIEFTGDLPPLEPFQGLVFTSANGVRAYLAAGGPADLPAYCVGARTAGVAQAAGFGVHSADGDISGLVALLKPLAGRFLYVRGEHVAGDLAGQIDVVEAVLYRQNPVPLSGEARQALAAGAVDSVVLYSPRTAALLAQELAAHADWPRDNITPLCLSRNIAARLENAGLPPAKIASRPGRDEMLALIGAFLG